MKDKARVKHRKRSLFCAWLGCVLVMLPFTWLIGGGWPAMLGVFVGSVVGFVLLMVFADMIPTPSVTEATSDIAERIVELVAPYERFVRLAPLLYQFLLSSDE